MEYIYENFIFPPDQSFTIRSEALEIKKYTAFKSHLNFEIALIENCAGKRLIGDHIEAFSGTELVLMGSYLPHCWQYHSTLNKQLPGRATVVHFYPDFLGNDLFSKPETKHLATLFANAAKGILFSGETVSHATAILQEMLYQKGLTRSSLLLRLLDIMAQSETCKVLSSPGFNITDGPGETNKINNIFDYVFRNFREQISLEDVASLIPMSSAAFCRFFKLKTGTTLTDFIKGVRIGHAAKLLLQEHYNVSEACYNSGYNNVSNFNKHFKEIKGLSPKDFMRQYTAAVA